jgi:NAD(P)-dependent dehydrogenase (short-subunit alcohol dehydrogenase family)
VFTVANEGEIRTVRTDSDKRLHRKIAVITGASSGVGRAIALALAREGASVVLLGRRIDRLRTVAEQCRASDVRAVGFQLDLLRQAALRPVVARILKTFGGVDILIHSAGEFARAPVEVASLADFDRQYRCNLRAPFALTQALLSSLKERRGQVVFINSTAGLVSVAGVSQYSATKHGLKAFADSLREEVNPDGVRVLSVFLGRTATPMQAKIHRLECKPYRPRQLIQPEQVASAVIGALTLGPEAEVPELRIRPAIKPRQGK